ncbi:MAG: hypothetical protein CFH06_00663 [Alphaproteobacteria bacterium MarineAlpha3_Bin5]|nr:MAG: hypothetical protein CFH06_00663 [Alphaproteobacteria bacterium MarineAlpha3_Bin5]
MSTRDLEEAERLIFKSAMKSVKPIRDQHKRQDHNDFTLGNGQEKVVQKRTKSPILSTQNQRSRDSSTYHVTNLDKRTKARIGKGLMRFTAKLDLHGLTQNEARSCLERFLFKHRDLDGQLVLVITGKGRNKPGVLRDSLPSWLSEYPINQFVRAYSYAHPKNGGDGAFYVALRRKKLSSY